MLQSIHIENIAVIESADIEFAGGFNVLTGETGAGKSMVIDAISALKGERASRDILRTGKDKASVTAVFTGCSHLPLADEDGSLLISREIYLDGRNVCRVNGKPATLSVLKELGNALINIHGQHDGQQLLSDSFHLEFLDGFAGIDAEKAAFAAAYEAYRATAAKLKKQTMDEAEKSRLVDSLTFQIDELERARLVPGEDAELAERKKVLSNATRLIESVSAASAALSGGDDEAGACTLISRAERELRSAGKISEKAAALSSRLAELSAEAEDVAAEAGDLLSELDFSPDEIERIEERLDLLYRLRRKYGDTAEEMLAYLEKAKAQLEEIELSDENRQRLEKELAAAKKDAEEKAAELSKLRKAAAVRMEAGVIEELSQLDMPKVRFKVDFAQKEIDETGADDVKFLLSANAGEALKPLSRIASGGEMSRIMLALKNVLSESDAVSTLIFDEVDAGVSGRAAVKVGGKLKQLGGSKQVLCVTHLPQIAAMADRHFSIEKAERDGRTYTAVTPLDAHGRTMEIARLMGGDNITENTLRSAREMLDGNDR
ncbi:MAG: DNA repair protein RecN [Oscillospiraceae bacterium]|nr:DNA repair protein RecN [Oscillospiraceae bacterium]